ncbi:MAG: YdiU family protein [Pseudomonadota bacterium]
MSLQPSEISFDNSYVRELDGFFVPWKGAEFPAPELLRLNHSLAEQLGLSTKTLTTDEGVNLLTGASLPDHAASIALAYAGHQFGGFSPQLGDGRALLVGEVLDLDGDRYDLHLKGSGRTPFSRGGDGKAVLGPVLREYLIGEAMHALGIPTSRALAASLTGEMVAREKLEQGAVLARVASSHLRIGTFQFFAARGETEKVCKLADYAINRHYPDLANQSERYLELFRRVRDAQVSLIAKWVLVGFVHGVMNTDNMTISGETIDYGPCAFIDTYDPKAVFSSIDEHGRYAYGSQPTIGQWNLARFAETLIDLVNPDDSKDAIERLTSELNIYPAKYQSEWLAGMRAKLGLLRNDDDDLQLANGLYESMENQNVDFTNLFRSLAALVEGNDKEPVRALFDDPQAGFNDWLVRYEARLQREETSPVARAQAMNRINPAYIPRNHLVEESLSAANEGDMKPFDQLYEVLSHPFDERPGAERFAEPAPADFGRYMTFCGT